MSCEKLTIVLWKWKGKTMGRTRPDYSARHVNIAVDSIDRHLKLPHEFVCVTDDPEGIDGGVRIVPMWDDLAEYGRCYRRLKLFAPEMAEIIGPWMASIDLDTVIVGPLDELFNRPEDFVIWSDPSRIIPYCGSQWMLRAGKNPEVFRDFDPALAKELKRLKNWHGSDQAWLALMLPNAPVWTKKDGVYSFRMHLMRHRRGDLLPGRFQKRVKVRGAPQLPENARIVHFHGSYDPCQSHLRACVPWIKENWRRTKEDGHDSSSELQDGRQQAPGSGGTGGIEPYAGREQGPGTG